MKSLYLLLFGFICLAFTAQPVDEIQLEYQFKVGDEYSWAQSKRNSVKYSFMGIDQEMNNNMHGEYHLRVNEVTAKFSKIEVQFKKLKTSSKSLIGQMSMDSDSPEETTGNKMVKAIIEKPFFVYLNTRGEVQKTEGTENLFSEIKDPGSDDKEQQLMYAFLKQFLSEPALKANFKEAFVVYPENKVKQGDSWDVTMQPGMNFPMILENRWNVVEILPVMANLTANGKIKTTDKNQSIEFAGIKARADLAGSQTGKTNVSLKSGWPSKQEAIADLRGTMTFLAGGMIPTDMEVPVEVLYKAVNVMKKKTVNKKDEVQN
jgi:hypothetical protein